MAGSKVSITFHQAASPYIVGDVASFPDHVAQKFIKAGRAHYTNPALLAKEQAIKRVRLGEPADARRPKAIHGSVTSGKDFTARPDELDMTKAEDASDRDEDQGKGLPEVDPHDPNAPAVPVRGAASGSYASQESKGHTANVGTGTDSDSKVYDAGGKSKAESAALAAGVDPAAAGEAQEAAEDGAVEEQTAEEKASGTPAKKKRVKLT